MPIPPAAPARTRRHRGRRAVLAVAVTVLVLFGLDRGAAALAGHEINRQLAASAGTQGASSATLQGFPFLDQVVRGRYDGLHVRVAALDAGSLPVRDLDVTLRGVHIGLVDAIRGRVRVVPVDHVVGTATLDYADLDAALKRDTAGLSLLEVSGDDKGLDLKLPLAGVFSLPGVSVRVDVAVDDGRLHLTYGGSLPALLRRAVQTSLPLPGLPYGLRLATAHTAADGIHFTVVGADAQLPAGQPPG